MLFISTVSNNRDIISRLRRRPIKTAINTRILRALFRESHVKQLNIPEFINLYNHFINNVNVVDQLRSYYTTQRTYFKTWKSL